MTLLIVRLGALGDIVHTIPAAAALRQAFPAARIDWLVERRHRAVVDLVTVVDRVVPLDGRRVTGWLDAAALMRQVAYDAALDFQGLMKSAVLARMSGARRIIGFSIWHLREKSARPFYSETGDGDPDEGGHVIRKNLRMLRTLGIDDETVRFPLALTPSAALDEVRQWTSGAPFALLNPGAAWPNKRWPARRFGEVAAFLREVRGWPSIVLWGPGEEALAAAVADASGGAARVAPPTSVADILAVARASALMVSGDTGPLHLAAAVGTPLVGVFGPTSPARNGPWALEDVAVSRFDACACQYDRRCHASSWCLEGVTVAEVTAALQQRLAAPTGAPAE